ncbi:O-antigen ligase family protein [Flavobacteriaceae bacterium]|jgi:O-antigen ligase|nr:O-antigen ligase family protein [Flavobacteriaceae bacterium]
MKLNLNIVYVSFYLILTGIFFLPFNSWNGISVLGEYYRDSCVLFFLLAFFILLFKKKIKLPLHSPIFYSLIVFLVWAAVTTALNFETVIVNYFKQTSGVIRFLRQYFSLILAAFILPVTFYNSFLKIDSKRVIYLIRKAIYYSFVIVIVYAIIEVLVVKFNLINLKKPVLNIFDYFPFVEAKTDLRLKRISSVTFEPPALGTYLITIFAWMCSYIITSKSYFRFLPALLVIVLAFISGSRAAFFIIVVQAFIFVFAISQSFQYNKIFSKIVLTSAIAITIGFLAFAPKILNYVDNEIQSFKLNDNDHSLSNKSRFGIQYAMYKVFLDNPVTGTGYGQQAFDARSKYPSWAKRNNWEFRLKYLNQNNKRFPPGYNLYLRLAAETGALGLLSFLLFMCFISIWCYNNLFKQKNLLAIIVFVSMAGFMLNWLKMDTFRIYGFWICLALIFVNSTKKISDV